MNGHLIQAIFEICTIQSSIGTLQAFCDKMHGGASHPIRLQEEGPQKGDP